MISKIKIVLALILMLGLVGIVRAEVYFWGNSSGDWAATTTWAGGVVPSPTAEQDIAIAIGGVTITVTTDGQGATDLYGGYDVGYNIINIAAGKHLQIAHSAQIGLGNNTTSDATGELKAYGSYYSEGLIVGANKYTTGIVNIYEGGSVNVGGWGLEVGNGAVGTGTVNLKGGTMAVASDIYVRSTGRINIEKGTLSLGSHTISVLTGRIDIREGTLTLQDDEVGTQMYFIQPYIDDGFITGYDGSVALTVDVNATTYIVKITAPGAPAKAPSPANGQDGVLLNAVLSWAGSSFAAEHDVYFGTDDAAVANATHASPEFKGIYDVNSYNPGGLIESRTYYWRVDEVNDSNVWTGAVWSFSTVRYPATNPSPADGQRKVALNAVMSWSGSAPLQDVYFGTDMTAVMNATHASPEFRGSQTATTYNPGGFVAGQGYYWRIDEVSGTNIVKGDTWSFATERTEAISFTRGITLDRQFHIIPPESWNTIDACDVALIKRMGFTFAKVLVNPQPMISGSTINMANMAYVDEIVNIFLNQNVPVVVCIHPEPGFKTTYLGSAGGFTTLLSFYHDFAGYLAARWGQNEVVFQLMTEPFGNYTDWNTMLPQMVSSVRSAMPNNTLIIGGAVSGKISGLTAITQACINAINDNNVYYGFTYWDESNLLPFLFQGGGLGAYYPYLKGVPYPSSTANNPADYILSTIPGDQYSSALAAVTAYCNTPWNMAKQQSVLQPIVDWNNARGGNLKLICYEMGVPIDPCQAVAGGGVIHADRIQYIHDKRLALEEKNIGWSYWSYNETFTVLNYPLRVAFEKGVTKRLISAETLIALGLPCGCGCITEEYPVADINSDCYVNFKDFAILALNWLNCTEINDAKCSH